MANTFRAVLLGPLGSGKSTIANKLEKVFHLEHVSSSNLLRQELKVESSELRRVIQRKMKERNFLSDDIMISFMTKHLNLHMNGSFVLEGYPVTLHQCIYMWNKFPVDLVLNLNVPEEVIMERISKRWVHLPSGRKYNEDYNKPKVPFVDDVTGEKLVQQEQDKPSLVYKQIKLYEQIIRPVLNFYKNKGILRNFYGSSTDDIWMKVMFDMYTKKPKGMVATNAAA